MTAWPVANPWSAPVLHLESTVSTMDDAQRLQEQGFPSGTVVVAGFQEQGRGRRPDRSWDAEAGKNLLFTLLLDLPEGMPPQRLPLLAGLALADAVQERFGLEAQVKWPNDLLCSGRKLAGVLCAAQSLPAGPVRVLVGVGLNCNQRVFPPPVAASACSLAQLLGREVELPGLLERILSALRACLGDGDWRSRLQSRLHGLGREAVIAAASGAGPGGPSLRGIVRGVAEDGALLLESGSGMQRAYSGELVFQAQS